MSTPSRIGPVKTAPANSAKTASGEDDGLWDHLQPAAARRLAEAGLACFAELGYHATTTRDIAERAQLSPAAVYVHYRSKGELLSAISRVGHESALATLAAAGEDEPDPRRRTAALVAAFASWHARNHRLARVVQYELDALPEEGRAEIMDLRHRFAPLVEAAVEEGRDAGAFEVADLQGATVAIISLCIDVARWYAPGGPRDPAEIGALYADLMLRMLGGAER
jgi:AcrR family transcriptional regulator